MTLTPFTWLVYALWALLIVYLTVSAIGVKEDTETRLGQSLGVTIAILAAFLLPCLPMFAFLNFAPVNTVLSIFGVLLCSSSFRRGSICEGIGGKQSPTR